MKILPWWLSGLIALAILPLTIDAGRMFLSGRSIVAAAQDASPPAAVGVAAFDLNLNAAPLDEVRLTGIWLSDLGIGTIAQQRGDDGYIVVKDAAGTAYAVLYFPSHDGAAAEKNLRALIDAQGLVTVSGFRETGRTISDAVTEDLIARGLAAGPPVVVLEPYFGDRAAALQDQVQEKMIVFAIFAGINLVFLAIAILKARAWRGRVAARRPVTAMPRVTATTARASHTGAQARSAVKAPRVPGDTFASGPIKSPKGWFR